MAQLEIFPQGNAALSIIRDELMIICGAEKAVIITIIKMVLRPAPVTTGNILYSVKRSVLESM